MARAKVGDTVRITGVMPDDPDPLEIGDEGVVTDLGPRGHGHPQQIYVDWRSGRTLILLSTDPFVVVKTKEKS